MFSSRVFSRETPPPRIPRGHLCSVGHPPRSGEVYESPHTHNPQRLTIPKLALPQAAAKGSLGYKNHTKRALPLNTLPVPQTGVYFGHANRRERSGESKETKRHRT